MTDADAKAFQIAMTALNVAYSRQQLSAETQVLYFRRLARFPLVQVERAIDMAIDYGGDFPPSIARLIELIEGSPEEAAALAWGRVHHAALKGYGGYRPLDFGDPVLHATVTGMGGWGTLLALGHRDAEGVDAAVARKEFLQLYVIYRRRGVPASTPPALCADTDRVGVLPAAVLDEAGEYPKRPLALPEPTWQPNAGDFVPPTEEARALFAKLNETLRLPPPPPAIPDEKPQYTQAEIDEQERHKADKVAEAKRWLADQGPQP